MNYRLGDDESALFKFGLSRFASIVFAGIPAGPSRKSQTEANVKEFAVRNVGRHHHLKERFFFSWPQADQSGQGHDREARLFQRADQRVAEGSPLLRNAVGGRLRTVAD